MTFNKMTAIGNVGTDPEMRYTPNGAAVTSFRLATNRRYTTSDGEQHEETEWFTVTAWNRLAEQVNQFVTKGMRVYSEGRLKSTSWTGNDGQLRFRNEIIANQVLFLDRSPDPSSSGDSPGKPSELSPDVETQNPPPTPQTDVEDLPW